MKLDMEFYRRAEAIEWLVHCGEDSRPSFELPVQWLEDRSCALQAMFSTQWADATTVAQGCLTGYLAKRDYDAYAHWNRLVHQSQEILAQYVEKSLLAALEEGAWATTLARTPLAEITPPVRASIGKRMADLRTAKAWERCLTTEILVNLSLAAVEMTYRRNFPKAPMFFERLLEVYEAGRLPCGWDGDLDSWPDGQLVLY
jgi:hypothetical protein